MYMCESVCSRQIVIMCKKSKNFFLKHEEKLNVKIPIK